jgi:hypothetical protein
MGDGGFRLAWTPAEIYLEARSRAEAFREEPGARDALRLPGPRVARRHGYARDAFCNPDAPNFLPTLACYVYLRTCRPPMILESLDVWGRFCSVRIVRGGF